MKWFLEFMFSDLEHFIGMCIVLGFPFPFIFQTWNRKIKARTIREKGYPPPYCDVDGDPISEETVEEEEYDEE
jgi:hypothetical protein